MRLANKVLVLALGTAQVATAQSIDPRVEAILARMTLEEKVGEMTQIDITAVTSVPANATRAPQIDSAKLDDIVVRKNVGSLLNVPGVALTPAQWVDLIGMIQRFAQRRRLPIPVIYGIDAVHGHHFMRGATIFPQNIGMAATWNRELVRHGNEITAWETRASGIPWNFSPVIDVGRQPLWSRLYETFGEDPYLVSEMGLAAVIGNQQPRDAQGTDAAAVPASMRTRRLGVAATGKHFLGYSMPLSGKDRTNAWIPERQLREYFLPSFRAAIDAGLRTIMVNSGEINGIPVHSSREILTDLLRTELHFDGVVVSDYEDIIRLNTVHHVARTRLDAVRMALDAGIDMSMVPLSTNFIDDVLQLVHTGAISESRINESVRRILKLKLDLGLFDNALADAAALSHAANPGFQAASRKAAEESITLLKNERGLLPLAAGTRILVTGPGATSITAMHGGWTYTWQGTDSTLHPTNVLSLLAAMHVQFGGATVTYSPGATMTKEANIAAAVDAARNADVIVVALGEEAMAEKPGDVEDLALPPAQIALARAMEATGKPVIITLFEARPRTVRDIVDGARAVVQAYLPGPYAGEAVARVLAGLVNPSGRLPYTYPRSSASIEHYDRSAAAEVLKFSPTGGYNPEWDFGFGLSYTTFAYDSIHVVKPVVGVHDTLVMSVGVTNTGRRAGMEVVQVYSHQLYASVVPPQRRLREFEKISLAPGERRVVTFRIPVSRLGFVGRDNRMGVEPGEFELHVGGRTAKLVVQ
jgi:beta-glucosidase